MLAACIAVEVYPWLPQAVICHGIRVAAKFLPLSGSIAWNARQVWVFIKMFRHLQPEYYLAKNNLARSMGSDGREYHTWTMSCCAFCFEGLPSWPDGLVSPPWSEFIFSAMKIWKKVRVHEFLHVCLLYPLLLDFRCWPEDQNTQEILNVKLWSNSDNDRKNSFFFYNWYTGGLRTWAWHMHRLSWKCSAPLL